MAVTDFIDVHHHFVPIEVAEQMERFVPPGVGVTRHGDNLVFTRESDGLHYGGIDPEYWCDIDKQVTELDAAGIDQALLSPACYQEWMTGAAATLYNDGVAQAARRYPGRIWGMASVGLEDVDRAVAELTRARRELGLVALNLTTHQGDDYLDHPKYRPIFRAAAELAMPVFFHASFHPPSTDHLLDWEFHVILGRTNDLTLAFARLLYSGVLGEFPDLRLVFAHLGGAASISTRKLFSPAARSAPKLDYGEHLSRVWFDTAPANWQGPKEIAFAASTLGEDKLMFGSDYHGATGPAAMATAREHLSAADLSDHTKAAIAAGTAQRCFGLS